MKKCPKGKEISIKSGKCVKNCKPEQVRNKETGRCRKKSPEKRSRKKVVIPKNKYLTKSGSIEYKVNTGRSVEYQKSVDLCKSKKYLYICEIISRYDILPENYFISKQIGKGTYGSVYLLCNIVSKKCDKVIKFSTDTSGSEFHHEIRMNKLFAKYKLAPAVVKGMYLSKKKVSVIIMDRVDMTLESYLKQDLTEKEVTKIFTKIKTLLSKLKKYNLLHGDFHAGNIGLTQKKNDIGLFMIDFGFSKQIDNMTNLDELDYLQLYRTLFYNKEFKGPHINKKNIDLVKKLTISLYRSRFGSKHVKKIQNKDFDGINRMFKNFYKNPSYIFEKE